jgi:hypothetical protein
MLRTRGLSKVLQDSNYNNGWFLKVPFSNICTPSIFHAPRFSIWKGIQILTICLISKGLLFFIVVILSNTYQTSCFCPTIHNFIQVNRVCIMSVSHPSIIKPFIRVSFKFKSYPCGRIKFSAWFCKPHFCRLYNIYLFYLSVASYMIMTQTLGFTYFTAWTAYKTLWVCPHIASTTTRHKWMGRHTKLVETVEIHSEQHGPLKLRVMPIHWNTVTTTMPITTSFCSQKENKLLFSFSGDNS